MTMGIEVMPTPPGVWSEPSATTTPLSSSARTGGLVDCCSAEPGEITAATPPRDSAATSSSVAACSRSADAQPSSAATLAAPLAPCACPQACSRGSSPAPRVEYPAGLFLGEPVVLAVDVDAVRAHGGRVRAPGRHRVDVVAAAAEELRRHHLRRGERDVHPRHAPLGLQRAEDPHVGELPVPGEVVAGLRLDRRGARL